MGQFLNKAIVASFIFAGLTTIDPLRRFPVISTSFNKVFRAATQQKPVQPVVQPKIEIIEYPTLNRLVNMVVPRYLRPKLFISDGDQNEYATYQINNTFGFSLSFCGLTAAEKRAAEQACIANLRNNVFKQTPLRFQVRWTAGAFCEGEKRSEIMHVVY